MAVATAYTTEADMRRWFSVQGVKSFADHDQDGEPDALVVSDCIDQATEEINLYCQSYSTTALAAYILANRWATVLACYFLCQRRGNPVPQSVADEFARIMAILQQVLTGAIKLPIARSVNDSPSFSNMTVDRRFPFSRVRVQRESSDQIPTTLTQKVAGDLPIE